MSLPSCNLASTASTRQNCLRYLTIFVSLGKNGIWGGDVSQMA